MLFINAIHHKLSSITPSLILLSLKKIFGIISKQNQIKSETAECIPSSFEGPSD